MCKVVHFKKDPYDIYIGRLPNGEFNKWAYPKELRDTFSEETPRKEIVEAYENYLLKNDDLMDSLPELMYKTIGCWCKGISGKGSCHGDILKKYVDRLEDMETRTKLINEK
jgi:hypothetical protein